MKRAAAAGENVMLAAKRQLNMLKVKSKDTSSSSTKVNKTTSESKSEKDIYLHHTAEECEGR